MYLDDLALLCCPETFEALKVVDGVTDGNGEIIEGQLQSVTSNKQYAIRNGIPRFVQQSNYNRSWDYKWSVIDGGKGLNYKILDKKDPAYRIHDLFDRNNHSGKAFQHAVGRCALDLGCGVGQYTIKLLQEMRPNKVVSLDLTGAVDIFRKIILERFPKYRRQILIVQANAFQMPFRDESFDFVFSLGVLMHTGDTRGAIKQATRVLKIGGQINLWVYGAIPVHIDNEEPDRGQLMTLGRFVPYWFLYTWSMIQVRVFRRLPHRFAVAILKLFSSQIWYELCRLPLIGYVFRIIFATVMHPDRDYRFINNYDGWCNTWAETWTESELFPTLVESNVVIRGISHWQTGIWGEKQLRFYR